MLWGVPQGLLDISNIQDFGVKVKKLAKFLRLAVMREKKHPSQDRDWCHKFR